MPPEQRAAGSAQARELLMAQALWHEAESVLFYAPLPTELDVWPLVPIALAGRKKVRLPRFDAVTGRYVVCDIPDATADLRPGHFGIREPDYHRAPIIINALGLILVPGVAFDGRGGRLGRGRGYYDRLLASVGGSKCAVAFDGQIVGEVPMDEHDVRMDYILTPTRWIEV